MHQVAVFSSSSDITASSGVNLEVVAGLVRTTQLADFPVTCLGEENAYEIAIPDGLIEDSTHQDTLLTSLRKPADTRSIDVNLVPGNNRRKKLLIADMDSTIITGESLDDMSQLAGMAEKIFPITRRAMRGELDFEEALDARLALLAGQPESLIAAALDQAELTAGAKTLVATMRANGAFCYLVSGGFTAITGPIAEQCGFHDHQANILEVHNGALMGRVKKPVLDSDAKAGFLTQYCKEHSLTPDDAACIGDGANDLAMLGMAGYGVAFKGKPLLRAKVRLQLNHTDLTGLLFLQGYHAEEFA